MPTEVGDAREHVAEITREMEPDVQAEDAFLASKVHIANTHPRLDRAERELALTELMERIGSERLDALAAQTTPPTPGGAGYGIFYDPPFKSDFGGGTALYFDIVCPTQAGGSVSDWLYLTAMNRASKGLEAFVSYYAQNDAHFTVFDWARTDSWQTNLPFGDLHDYLGSDSAHGSQYQTLGVWNVTLETSAGQWRNEAWLFNRVAHRWDLIYRYDYAATQAEQKGGWIGSWGPVVETFESLYVNTNQFGALNAYLISRSSPWPSFELGEPERADWLLWQFLRASNSYIRTDNQGFLPVFLDANYAFVVDS
jgi:hypothetical protein